MKIQPAPTPLALAPSPPSSLNPPPPSSIITSPGSSSQIFLAGHPLLSPSQPSLHDVITICLPGWTPGCLGRRPHWCLLTSVSPHFWPHWGRAGSPINVCWVETGWWRVFAGVLGEPWGLAAVCQAEGAPPGPFCRGLISPLPPSPHHNDRHGFWAGAAKAPGEETLMHSGDCWSCLGRAPHLA